MSLLHSTTRLEVEPSAAVGLAAIAQRAKEVQGFRAATVVTGANLTQEQRRAWYAVSPS
jgi:threonine dehydratase